MRNAIYSLFVALCLCCFFSCSRHCEEQLDLVEFEPCSEVPLDVHVTIVDKRWCKEGGYAMPNISVYLKKDLAILIREPIIDAFKENNLIDSPNGAEVNIEIEQFFCDVLERKSSWNCVSEILLGVKVSAKTGEPLFERRISGVAENDFEKTERNGKARKALNSAVDEVLINLLGDRGFCRAIEKASALPTTLCD